MKKLRCLAFLPPDLVRDGFEQLRVEYVDQINLVLGPERAPLVAEFMTYERQLMDNPSIQKREWNVKSLDSYRTNNYQEGNNHRINCRITPTIAGNLRTFMKALMKKQICQSRLLDQFEHGGRFALRKKVYRENEERVEILMYERTNGNLDTMQFLDAMYHRIGD